MKKAKKSTGVSTTLDITRTINKTTKCSCAASSILSCPPLPPEVMKLRSIRDGCIILVVHIHDASKTQDDDKNIGINKIK
jgi:hypothetical protein